MQKRKQVTEKDRATCVSIHQQLLESVEEVCYPAETHILCMLQHSQCHSDRPLQATWQDYLCQQMNTGTYIDYQSCALLWAILFPEQQAQQNLASVLLEHFSDNTKLQRYAQRFLIGVVNDLRDLRDLINWRYWRDLINWRYFRDLIDMRYWIDLRDLEDLIDRRDLRDLRDRRDLRYWRYWRYLLLTEQVVLEIEQRLHTCSEAERAELLTILFGRVLHIQRVDETDTEVEQEVQRIVQVALPFVQPDTDARDIVLDIVRCLPANMQQALTYALDFAQRTQDHDLQRACERN